MNFIRENKFISILLILTIFLLLIFRIIYVTNKIQLPTISFGTLKIAGINIPPTERNIEIINTINQCFYVFKHIFIPV